MRLTTARYYTPVGPVDSGLAAISPTIVCSNPPRRDPAEVEAEAENGPQRGPRRVARRTTTHDSMTTQQREQALEEQEARSRVAGCALRIPTGYDIEHPQKG